MKNVMFKSMMLIGMLTLSTTMSAQVKSDNHHGQYKHEMYNGHSNKHHNAHGMTLHIKHNKHCKRQFDKHGNHKFCKCDCHYMMHQGQRHGNTYKTNHRW